MRVELPISTGLEPDGFTSMVYTADKAETINYSRFICEDVSDQFIDHLGVTRLTCSCSDDLLLVMMMNRPILKYEP